MSSVSLKRKLTGMAAELVFSDEATFHLSGKVTATTLVFSNLTRHSVPMGLLKSKCLALFHITTIMALSLLQKTILNGYIQLDMLIN
jgi:hypothetical protein